MTLWLVYPRIEQLNYYSLTVYWFRPLILSLNFFETIYSMWWLILAPMEHTHFVAAAANFFISHNGFAFEPYVNGQVGPPTLIILELSSSTCYRIRIHLLLTERICSILIERVLSGVPLVDALATVHRGWQSCCSPKKLHWYCEWLKPRL